MKKAFIILLICFAVLLTGCSNKAQPDTSEPTFVFSHDGVIEEYYMDEQTGTCGLNVLDTSSAEEWVEMAIPAEYEGNKITFIGVRAGYQAKKIKDLHIDEGILEIFNEAFAEAEIESVSIPASVTYIASDVFRDANVSTIYFAGDKEVWESFSVTVPEECTVEFASGAEMTQPAATETKGIFVENMEKDKPYVLKDNVIVPLAGVGYSYPYIYPKYLNNAPVFTGSEQIIIKSENKLRDVYAYLAEIDFSRYIYPSAKFWDLDGKTMVQSSMISDWRDAKECDNINDIPAPGNMKALPLFAYEQGWGFVYHMLYNDGAPKNFTVGYWVGTEYKEQELSAECVKFSRNRDAGIKCEYIRTKEGYFILDTNSLGNGYYIIEGLGGNYMIKVEK